MSTNASIQAHANNFLAPEPFIVDRLKDALADLRPQVHVLTASDLALVKEESQPTPAVHVIWNGFRVADASRGGRTDGLQATQRGRAHALVAQPKRWTQRWLCLPAARLRGRDGFQI